MGISYSVEVDDERTAKAMGRELSISKKDAVEVCREVKGMPLQEAREKLRAVADGETPIPRKRHNSGTGHRSDLDGWDAGSFPKKATEKILDILYNAVSNAENQGYNPDEMVIQHIAAHKVGESRGMKPRAMGRATQWNGDLVDVEVVVLQEEYEPEEEDEEEEEQEVEQETETEETVEEVGEVDEGTEEDFGELTDVEGIGDSKAEAFRDAGYETPEDLRDATQEEISEVEGVGNALAARVKADVGGIEVEEEADVEEEDEIEEEGAEESEEKDESDTETEESEGSEGEDEKDGGEQ